jgi:antitoxin HigA-1
MHGMNNSADALSLYLDQSGETLSGLASRIGRSPSTLTRALRGERDASLKLARDIERGTDGKVSASDFIAICLRARANETPTTPEAA